MFIFDLSVFESPILDWMVRTSNQRTSQAWYSEGLLTFGTNNKNLAQTCHDYLRLTPCASVFSLHYVAIKTITTVQWDENIVDSKRCMFVNRRLQGVMMVDEQSDGITWRFAEQ